MSTSSSSSPSKSPPRGSSHKRKKSEEVDIQRKKLSIASLLQPVNRFTEDVRDAQSRFEAGDGNDLGIFIISALSSQIPSSTFTARESAHKRKKSEEVDIQRKKLSIGSLLQPVDRFTEDAQSREAGAGNDPGISIISTLPSQIPSSKSAARGSAHKRKKSEEVDIQRKELSIASLVLKPVDRFTEDVLDAQSREAGAGNDPDISIISTLPSQIPSSKSAARGSAHKRKRSEGVNIQRKKLSIASLLQPVDRFTENVRDVQSEEAGDGSDPRISIISTLPSQIPPPTNSGNGDKQSRGAGGGGNLDFPISTNAHRFADKSLHSVNRKEEVVQEGDTPSTTFFQGSSNFTINNSNFNEIHGNATIIRFGDGQFTEVQRNLICDYIANLAVLPDINHNLSRNFLTQSIINLPRAEAVFDDYQTKKKNGPCFEGTRVVLLREMAEWVTGLYESKMYVLSGLAGIGKSTVAYTVASRAANLNLLGASFFFSRDESDRKNAKKFFTTIAYQLCVFNETFAKATGDVLQTQRGSAAITKSPQEQLQALIVDPLRSIVQPRARPILVVVDALDECDEEDALSVLAGLRQLVRALPSFNIILTTRPQPHLDRFFGSRDGHKVFHLQDIEDKVVDDDIRLYLNHRLSLQEVQERVPTSQWSASDKEVDALVRAAGRLFIIASTVVRIILDNIASNPAAQMQKLLGTFAQDRMPFKDLNEFYTVIRRNVVPADCDNDIVNRYQSVVGAITFVQHPLPVTTLAHLIDVSVDDIRAVLVNLRSVILLGDDDIPRIYHKTFPDYITDLKLCKDGNLRIDAMIHHMRITIRCFQKMEQHLKYNILGLGTPARFMSNKDGLAKDSITDEQLEGNIPQQLRYACVHWANHLEVADIENDDVMKELERFADKHMLHWFEALSLIGKLDTAHRTIRVVLKGTT
ncbi:hypothetical protein M378DRAFT_591467 [Amanita muscaria Koide BX008]|uniref:NACHT domain-containing protein n=1 Tax=Amanita muscaria (strain Koide BX008) TaxID=946122 RepID=A0A0C2W324_AMAMK|nr:hypothetical protein M378DRAFT_591467 [Amanita muscaria Koide BX008]